MVALRQVRQLASATFAVIVMAASVFAQAGQQDELNTAVREASDNLNSKIPKGNKIVVLNVKSEFAGLSDYIINKLIENAVNDGLFTVVDRQQIEEIQTEQKFQMSGAVDDKDALAIGQFFGAQTIVSGAVNSIGKVYNLSIRALDVQTASVQAQFNRNIKSSEMLNSLAQEQTAQEQSGQPAQPAQQIIIVQQGQQTAAVQPAPKPPKPPKPRTHDWYFAPKYQLPAGIPVSWGAINLEGGLLWKSGKFIGIDLGGGYGGLDTYEWDGWRPIHDQRDRQIFFVGGGFSMGSTIDLFEQAQIVYGGSLGFWTGFGKPTWRTVGNEAIWTTRRYDIDFLGPFVKLRWKFVEISYRGLIGAGGTDVQGVGTDMYIPEEKDPEWGLKSQLMIGLYLKTSKMGTSR